MKSPNIQLGVAIMAVPERAERVGRLLSCLDVNETRVSWDPAHDGHVANWWRAVTLCLADSQVTHALILEDDAEPCRDFLVAAEQLVARFPERTISFYSGRREHDLQVKEARLVPHFRALTDVAVVYPREWLEELRRDYEAQKEELEATQWQLDYGADEMRIKLRPKRQVWHTLPSLVQHGCPSESTLGHRIPNARASVYIGANVSALTLDWTTT